jgi:hypothetical protein
MSTFLDNEKPFLLTLPLNEVRGRAVVAPLDKCGGDGISFFSFRTPYSYSASVQTRLVGCTPCRAASTRCGLDCCGGPWLACVRQSSQRIWLVHRI